MQNEKCKSPKGRAQIDSLRPKKVPYSLCRDVMARACTESNQRSKGKLEAQFPFKIPPILHTYTCHSTTVIRVQYAIGLPSCFLSCISIFFDRNRRSATLDWIWNESLQRRIKSKILFENWILLVAEFLTSIILDVEICGNSQLFFHFISMITWATVG